MKVCIFVIAAWTVCGFLFGCASQPEPFNKYADCSVPVTRNAGMGTTLQGCAVYTFGAALKR